NESFFPGVFPGLSATLATNIPLPDPGARGKEGTDPAEVEPSPHHDRQHPSPASGSTRRRERRLLATEKSTRETDQLEPSFRALLSFSVPLTLNKHKLRPCCKFSSHLKSKLRCFPLNQTYQEQSLS
ncbi:hypothetical protein TSAR_013749, partial [Trichomalopsis sarcophagae]